MAWIVAGLEDAVLVGGLSALGAGLYSIGIPKDSIVTYEAAVKAGEYLVVAHGTSAEAATAREILQIETTPCGGSCAHTHYATGSCLIAS